MSRTFRFGPGALEGIRLRVWTVPDRTRVGRRRKGDARHLAAIALGTFRAYGPAGETLVAIAERCEAWTSEGGELAGQLTAARAGDKSAAELVAAQLVEWTLDEEAMRS